MTAVLFLTESFHPVLGGGERHIRVLSERLVQRGLRCTVVTRRTEAAWPAVEELSGVRVVRVGPAGPARLRKYLMVGNAVRAVRSEPFDVLVVRGTRVLGLPGYRAARRLGRPVVLQPELNGELSGEVYTWGTPLHRRPVRAVVEGAVALRNRSLRHADAFVAMSREIRAEMVAAGVDKQRVHLIPHGVDTDHFRPADKGPLRAQLGLPADSLVITYTGRLLRGKGLASLLEAARSVPGAHVVLVGSGAGQALSVEEELRASAGPNVTFAGRVDDVAPWLQASDVFAFPSEFEALGISLVEAAACGLACVGSRTGGIVDVLEHERNGLLVEPGNVAELAAALRRLAGDASLRARLGAAARETAVAHFDLDRSVERYRELFGSLSSRASASPTGRAPRAGGAPPR